MCGIVGTIYNKNYHLGTKVNKEQLNEIFALVKNGDEKVEKFLDFRFFNFFSDFGWSRGRSEP